MPAMRWICVYVVYVVRNIHESTTQQPKHTHTRHTRLTLHMWKWWIMSVERMQWMMDSRTALNTAAALGAWSREKMLQSGYVCVCV
jgi:hypothetical protein